MSSAPLQHTPPPALVSELQILQSVALVLAPRGARTASGGLSYKIPRVRETDLQHPERVPLLLRALQRLAQLAVADESAWGQHVAWLWPGEARDLRSHRRRVIGLSLFVRRVPDIERLGHHLVTLEQGVGDHEDDAALAQVPIPIGVDLRAIEDGLGAMLTAILSITTRPAAAEEATTVPRYRVTSVSISDRIIRDLDSLARLTELADHGVSTSDVPPFNLNVTTQTAQIVGGLQSLLNTYGSRRTACHPARSDQRVHFAYNAHDPLARMVLSAVGGSSSARELTTRFSGQRFAVRHEATSPTVAAWLAYAIFSRESRHRIRRFAFEPRVHFAHQEAQAVLEAADPVAALFPECAAGIAQHAHERLAASTFVLFEPADDDGAVSNRVVDASTNADLTDRPHIELRIIGETSAWWSVVLPAWGRAWVRKLEATVSTVTVPSPNGRRHQIPDVSVSVGSTEELTQTLSWLGHVGAGTRSVSFSLEPLQAWRNERNRNNGDEVPVIELSWNAVLTAFPNAKKLRVSNLQVASLAPLVDWIGAEEHHRLRHLRLHDIMVLNADDGLPAFLDQLSNDRNPMATQLQSLGVVDTRSHHPHMEIVAAALHMLAHNTHLRTFKLALRLPAADNTECVALRAAFAAHDNTPLRSNLRKQRALLSVIADNHGGRLGGLDSAIVTEIFRFTGLCQRRVVRLQARSR